jgi:crotonobetainyl-CoA:carnitine CoA-transferase CaiB-like acyl-CoA transferase
MNSLASADPHAPVLAGIRVVILNPDLAGCWVGMLLSDLGAEVVRWGRRSHPTPERLRAVLGRGQTDLELTEPGLARNPLTELARHADIVIGEATEISLDAKEISLLRQSENRKLIHLTLPAFGPEDRAGDSPALEPLINCAGGVFQKPLGGPVLHDIPIASVMASLFGANALLAALFARARTGDGQTLTVRRSESGLFSQVLTFLIRTGVPRAFLPLKMAATPFMGVFPCADGRFIYLHITLPNHASRMLGILKENGFADSAQALRDCISPETLKDPSQVKSIPEARAIRERFRTIFRSKPAAFWESLLGDELCCVMVRTAPEWLAEAERSNMTDACRVEDPEFGPLLCPGPATEIDGSAWKAAPRRSLKDSKAIAERWAAAPAVLCAPVEASRTPSPGGPPLSGLRVLDMSRVIAGPCAGRMLAELGADVTIVQSPGQLDWALSFHLVFNAGKRSLALDLNGLEGKQRLERLLAHLRPDVLVQNYRSLDVARAVGIHPADLRRRHPDLVNVHLNAYGHRGPWQKKPGFEQVIQAVTGLQLLYGRNKPRLYPAPVLDIASGLLGSLAALTGLLRRQRDGKGCDTSTHMTSASIMFQSASLGGDGDVSPAIANRLIFTRDGNACLAGPPELLERFLRQERLEGPLGRVRLALIGIDALRQRLRKARLESCMGVVPLLDPKRLTRTESKKSPLPLACRRAFPGLRRRLLFVRFPLLFSGTPTAEIPPPPMVGQHSQEILKAIGDPGAGVVVPYPEAKAYPLWLIDLVRWGYYAWRSGSL